ncbi:hypothetical protein [Clostridium amazonitimonense]|uniref:hypothetical protein n=1 Tax=Clostridium amazonitimonense TaxID=1499689 RepID=UPI000509F114|nr:hypothetical protein [Clostridium amazonitimonense]
MEKGLKDEQVEVLQTAREYMGNLTRGMDGCIIDLREGRINEGLSLISPILEGMQWIYDVVRLTKDVQKDPMDEKEMEDKLKEMIEAFENQDFVLISDLMEYEILPILNLWKDGISKTLEE